MTAFNISIKFIYRMSRTRLRAVPPDFPIFRLSSCYVLAHNIPTELVSWLVLVVVLTYHTIILTCIATNISICYH